MTGGRIVVLGKVGRNFAAGMSGGVAYVLDEAETIARRANRELCDLEAIDEEDEAFLRRLVCRHIAFTNSAHASHLLFKWTALRERWVKVMPRDYKRVLQTEAKAREAGRVAEFNELLGVAHG
jgi:glutamate synthase domain-containing protein 3